MQEQSGKIADDRPRWAWCEHPQDQESSCIQQTFLSLLMRVIVLVLFGDSFAQLRLMWYLCMFETRVVVPGRQSYKILSLTRPLVPL